MLMLIACDSEPEVSPEQRVADRAAQRWQALIDKDLNRAYEFFSPAYRQAVSVERYKGSFGGSVIWQDAEVKTVKCGENVCDVTMMIVYKYNVRAASFESNKILEEKWILSDGAWWYFQEI